MHVALFPHAHLQPRTGHPQRMTCGSLDSDIRRFACASRIVEYLVAHRHGQIQYPDMEISAYKKEIQELVITIRGKLKVLAQHEDYADAVEKPGSPATADELGIYEDFIGHKIPNSYRAFLELYNGFEKIAYPFSMLSIADVMPGGRSYSRIQGLKSLDISTDGIRENEEVIQAIVIGGDFQPNNWVFLDPREPLPTGEFPVVEWDNGELTIYRDIPDFLRNSVLPSIEMGLQWCQENPS